MIPLRPLAALPVALALAAAGPPPAPGLDSDPLVAEPIGLRMHLPEGAIVIPQLAEGVVSYAITGGGGEAEPWNMRISTLSPALPQVSAEVLMTEHLEGIKATGRPYRILSAGPRTFGGVEGQLLYLEHEIDEERKLVNGWLLLPTSARTFVTFTVLTTAEFFPRIRGPLESSFSTIELRTNAELLDERQAQLERGRALVGTFTPEHLRSAVAARHWFRIFRPAGTGRAGDDVEVGILSVTALEAPRGQLTPERSAQSYSALESERGLMVLVEARAIIDAEKGHYLDVDGRYWMGWDRSTEAWSLRQTQRIGDASQTTAETGLRNGGTLEVIHSLREQLTREPSRWTVPDAAYLCQPEVFLLGTLLPRDRPPEGALGFFYYDAKSRQLTQRVDRWARSRDGTGNWLLTTTPMLDVSTTVQRFDADGRRLARVDADGTVTRRTDPDELRRLWRSKGLLTR
jgi:hypothetical protein